MNVHYLAYSTYHYACSCTCMCTCMLSQCGYHQDSICSHAENSSSSMIRASDRSLEDLGLIPNSFCFFSLKSTCTCSSVIIFDVNTCNNIRPQDTYWWDCSFSVMVFQCRLYISLISLVCTVLQLSSTQIHTHTHISIRMYGTYTINSFSISFTHTNTLITSIPPAADDCRHHSCSTRTLAMRRGPDSGGSRGEVSIHTCTVCKSILYIWRPLSRHLHSALT